MHQGLFYCWKMWNFDFLINITIYWCLLICQMWWILLIVFVLVVSKVLIAATFSNLCNFGPERDLQKSQNNIDRSIEHLTTLFHVLLAYLPLFQCYEGFKKLEHSILLRLLVPLLLWEIFWHESFTGITVFSKMTSHYSMQRFWKIFSSCRTSKSKAQFNYTIAVSFWFVNFAKIMTAMLEICDGLTSMLNQKHPHEMNYPQYSGQYDLSTLELCNGGHTWCL